MLINLGDIVMKLGSNEPKKCKDFCKENETL